MEQNYTSEQLDSILGTGSKQFQTFRTITIDNGTDTMGTGATGNFVEKKYDSTSKQTTREPFADIFDGVILSSKAQVVDKAKYPSWRSGEFDPSNKNELIDVFPLSEGKMIKDANGNIKKTQLTYDKLKQAKSTPQPGGGSINTYNYFIVLYVGFGDEIIKLKFKGTSRGNYFDYSKEINKLGAKIYNIITSFSTYIDKATGKYAIKFEPKRGESGEIMSSDFGKVNEMRLILANIFTAFGTKQLQSPQRQQISAPDNSDIRDDEIITEEIPFDGSFGEY